VATVLDHDQLAARYLLGHFEAVRKRRQPVLPAADHHRRAVDQSQVVPAVRAVHQQSLLAQKGVPSDTLGHIHDAFHQSAISNAFGMNQLRQQSPGHSFELPDAGEIDEFLAELHLLLRVGTRRGVEQSEPDNPVGRLAHDLQRDAATHRQAGQRELLGGGCEDSLRGQARLVCFRQIGNGDFGDIGQRLGLMPP
jgi:hypothetical protein